MLLPIAKNVKTEGARLQFVKYILIFISISFYTFSFFFYVYKTLDWGIGYQWNPLTAYAEAGDIFEWTWTSQPWILTFTHRIEQTKSESSTDRATDGFISSTKGTFNG